MLTFTVDNWNTAQTVTVKAGEDNDGANDTGTLTHTASGGDYAGITKDLPVTVTDNDEPAIVLSETDLTVTEGDAAGSSYTVKLATRPSDSVTVSITGHDGTDLSLSGTTLSSNMLTFAVDNWNTAQTVTVKAGQDNDGANDTGTLTHTASGGDYASITKDLPVTVTDNDEPAIVLSETDGGRRHRRLTVTEGDAAGSSYTVKLATRPSDSVTVSITGHDGTDLSLSGTTLSSNMLTFAVDNWNTAQTVTVKAGQDNDGANDTGTLTHTASGGDYASITKDLPVTVTDNDEPAIVLSETDLTVTEGDAAGSSYTVKLATRPSDSVTVSITGHDGTDLSLSGTTLSSNMLTFAVDNWNTAQTVTVKAGQDNDGANDTGTLTHTASGGDYASITKDLPVTVTDNDEPAIVLSETDLTVTEGDAAGSSYTVKLATRPSDSVTVSITGHDGTDLSLSGTTLSSNMLTFAVDNWNTAQTVTVKAGQDNDGANDTGTLTHTASGGDYASITKDLPVTITDDDCGDVDIWCATMKFNATVHWEGRYDLYTAEVDNREFSHNGADYQLLEITVPQNGHDSGDDNHVVLPFGIPERTHFLIDFLNLSGTSDQVLEPPNNDWLDWTLHVSTVSDGETLTATLRFSEARKLAGAWWRWSGGDIDDLRRAWKEGQPYKLRLVEDPRSERTPQPLNPPLYLRVKGEEDGGRTQLYWLTPQTRNDRVPPVDSYKIQWKQSSGSWDTATAVSETTRGHSSQRPVSHFLDGLTPGVEYNIRVIATDSVGDSEPSNEITYTKPAVAQQSLSNTPAEGDPRIDGIPEVGQTLSADTTAIADARRPRRGCLPVPVAGGRRGYRRRHRRHLHRGVRRRGQGHQGEGHLHRRCRPRGGADQRAHRGDGGGPAAPVGHSGRRGTDADLQRGLGQSRLAAADCVRRERERSSTFGCRRGVRRIQCPAVPVVGGGGRGHGDGGLHRARRHRFYPGHAGQEGGLLQRAGGHERHGFAPADGQRPRRAVVSQRAGRVHLRAAVQRGSQTGLQLHDGAGPCVHRDRGVGDLCAPAGAGQERPLGDHRRPRLQRRRDHSPEPHHQLLRPGRHLHRGRREAVQWASAGGSRAKLAGHRVAHHHRDGPGGGDPHR